jgi:hypothetical protein
MKKIKLLAVILSFLLLGAHFLREHLEFLAVIALLFPFLLFLKKAWIPRLFQITLLLGALEWIRSLYLYILLYQENGKSCTKLILIIGSVALFTALSALVFRSKSI